MAGQIIPQRETVEVEIGGFTYKITKLPGKAGALLGRKLLRMVGAAAEAGNVIEKFFDLLSEAEFSALLDVFKKETAYSPVDQPDAEFHLSQTFDQHFSGHYGRMVLWLKSCLEVNFANFLDETGIDPALLQSFMATATAKAMPSSPIASKASSGASSTPVGEPTPK
jgi:hypothetical protein